MAVKLLRMSDSGDVEALESQSAAAVVFVSRVRELLASEKDA